ncbi:MAG: class I SAM-dependent methyltransferase [Verrucomicrobiales bacterium]
MSDCDLSQFYSNVLKRLLDRRVLSLDDRILVVCGGPFDKEVLQSMGFRDVTITNLDERQKVDGGAEFAPYRWDFQDLESLSYADESYDVVLVHSGLHHLSCPQRGLNEMYRVARRAVIGFEPHRNLYTTLGVKLGAGQAYEDAAVYYNDCRWGGVANTEIPNYVVRFNRGDIERTVQIYNPIAHHKIDFFYATRIPCRLQGLARQRLVGRAVSALTGVLAALGRLPFLANNLAFCIHKPRLPDDLFPWLMLKDGRVTCHREWLEKKYRQPAAKGS